jgi:hypothetical protein
MKGNVDRKYKIYRDGNFGLLLLPCGATGTSKFDVDSISTLSILRSAKKFLVGRVSTDWSFGRMYEGQGFPIFLLFTAWRIASFSTEIVLFLRLLLAGSDISHCWFEDSGSRTGNLRVLREFSSVLNCKELSKRC